MLVIKCKKYNISTNFFVDKTKYWKNLGFYSNLSQYGMAKQLLYVLENSVKNFNLTNHDVFALKKLAKKYTEDLFGRQTKYNDKDKLYDLFLYRFINEYHKEVLTNISFELILKDLNYSIERKGISEEVLENIFKEISDSMEIYLIEGNMKYNLEDLIEIFKGTEAYIYCEDETDYADISIDKSLIKENTVSEIEIFLANKQEDKEVRIQRLKPLVENSSILDDFDEILGVRIPHTLNSDLYFSVNSILLKNSFTDSIKVIYTLKDYTPFIHFYNEIIPCYLRMFDVEAKYYQELMDTIKKASTLTYSV